MSFLKMNFKLANAIDLKAFYKSNYRFPSLHAHLLLRYHILQLPCFVLQTRNSVDALVLKIWDVLRIRIVFYYRIITLEELHADLTLKSMGDFMNP